MTAETYADAIEQHRTLRQRLKRRLKGMRDARESLSHTIGRAAAVSPTLEITDDPLTQIEPLVAEASQLSREIQRGDASVNSLTQELSEARSAEARLRLILISVGAVVVAIVLIALFAR